MDGWRQRDKKWWVMHLVSKAAMKMGYCTFPRWSRGSLSNSCSNWGSEISRPNLWKRSEEGQHEVTGVTAPTRKGRSVQRALSIRHSLTLAHTVGSGGQKINCPLHPVIAQRRTHTGQSIKGLDFTYTYAHHQIFTWTNYNLHSLHKPQIKTNELIKRYE